MIPQNHKRGHITCRKSRVLCVVLCACVIMIDYTYSKSHLVYSQSQDHSSLNRSILEGIWVGKGISLTLSPNGKAMLKQSDVLRSEESQGHSDGRVILGQQPQSSGALQLIGFWWETSQAHQRNLCLFFDLTAHCSPVMISPLQPNELVVHIGRFQAILQRQVVVNLSVQ